MLMTQSSICRFPSRTRASLRFSLQMKPESLPALAAGYLHAQRFRDAVMTFNFQMSEGLRSILPNLTNTFTLRSQTHNHCTRFMDMLDVPLYRTMVAHRGSSCGRTQIFYNTWHLL